MLPYDFESPLVFLEKKPAQKEEEEVTSSKGTSDDIVVATNSSLKATEVVKDDKISEMDASSDTPQDPTIGLSTEVFDEISLKVFMCVSDRY